NPKLWSAEIPNLYRAVVELHTADGTLIEAEACDVGYADRVTLRLNVETRNCGAPKSRISIVRWLNCTPPTAR
ncbi:hypothetical protein CPF13_28240, partial [Klebsiella pneumoniae]